MNLVAVEHLQERRGIQFPAEYKLRQIIVTGPPGSGKSTLISRIGGWPEEGYIDLALNGWWKAPSLTFRPREAHLGIPCHGFSDSLAVFDKEWVESDPPPAIDYDRIRVLPGRKRWFGRDWRAAYVFEVLLPPPEQILSWRLARQSRGTHSVDERLVLDEIVRQHRAYRDIAEFFHLSGTQLYIREGLDQPPKRLPAQDTEADARVPI